MLGLDLVPRIEWEPLNVNTLSPVDLFLVHNRSSVSTSASSVRLVLSSKTAQFSGSVPAKAARLVPSPTQRQTLSCLTVILWKYQVFGIAWLI